MSRMRPNYFSSSLSNKVRKMSSMIEIFKGLEPSELASFFKNMQVRVYPAGSMVFMPEDSTCRRLYILTQGRVALYRLTAAGKRMVTRQILPGTVFGVRGVLGHTMRRNFAEAIEDSTIAIVTRKQFLAYLKRQPDLILRLLETTYNALCLLEERLTQAVYSPIRVRLAYFLLTNVDSASEVLANFTHEEIGNTIGAVRQTVTETLSIMQKQGLVLTKPKQIQIIDRHGLEEIIRDWNS
jgi:CRP-like cAMP-binding protein